MIKSYQKDGCPEARIKVNVQEGACGIGKTATRMDVQKIKDEKVGKKYSLKDGNPAARRSGRKTAMRPKCTKWVLLSSVFCCHNYFVSFKCSAWNWNKLLLLLQLQALLNQTSQIIFYKLVRITEHTSFCYHVKTDI